jgi:hypothetical protein
MDGTEAMSDDRPRPEDVRGMTLRPAGEFDAMIAVLERVALSPNGATWSADAIVANRGRYGF